VPPIHPVSESTHSDPSSYEQACLREVLKELADVPVDDPQEGVPTNIHEVRLEGSYPDTKLTIVLSRVGAPTPLEWGLWGDDFGEVPEDGPRASPGVVANDVMVQVYEF
jgi:hypothetical protein